MTREEAIKILQGAIKKPNTKDGYLGQAIDMAIQSLEQEPKTDVLDKIRAEIKALSPEPTAEDVIDGNPIKDTIWEILVDVLQIIDKYKAESEDKE